MKLPRLCCLLVLLGAIVVSSPASAEDMGEIKARAGELTAAGQELLNAEQFLEAAAKFREAYELVPHPVLLYNQGICHRLAGNRFTARKYYRKYLAVQSEGELADLSRKFIAELDASIAEDSTPDPNPEPGKKPAKDKEPALHISELPAKPPAKTVTEQPPSQTATVTARAPSGRRMSPLTWALAGTSLVSLGVGSFFAISGYSDYSDCDSRGTCETNEEVDDIDTKLILGDVFIGIGLASGVAAGVLYWLSEEETPAIGVTTTDTSAAVHYRFDF